MTTPEAIEHDSITVAIDPKSLRWARYEIGQDGDFTERGVNRKADGKHVVIALAGAPGTHVPVTYDTTTARTAAAHLLGYAHQVDLGEPMPDHLLTTLLAPDTRTATGTTWHLGSGLALHYIAPFGTSLTTESAEWMLTAELATRWARALLTLAAELDHAHAVAAQAILAERTGKTPTENIRAWLIGLDHELTAEQKRLAELIREVLADEEGIARGETLFTALDVVHPDLPTSLADLRLLSRETLTHLDAADVIEKLADRYALPMSLWTAESWYVRDEIGGGRLTEQEWLRVGRTVEMRNFGPMIEHEQGNNGAALDVRLALILAGVLCRGCGTRITGEVAATLGRCDECRPADPDAAMAEALAAGCPGVYENHVPGSRGSCMHCGLPLPEYYGVAVGADHAE